MKLVLNFLLMGILINTSCNKVNEYHTIVRGKVINVGSKKPIDSVLIVIRDGISSNNDWFDLHNLSSGKTSFTYTNNEGLFEIDLIGSHFAYLGLSKSGYQYEFNEGGSVIGYKPFAKGIYDNEVLEMKADAWFKPILKSKEVSKKTDTVIIEILSSRKSEYDISQRNNYGITGFGSEFFGHGPFRYEYRSVGHSYLPFRVTVKRQGINSTTIDSVYIKSFDVYRDTIYY